MRQKKEAVLCFASNEEGLPKVVRDYRARYRAIGQVLDKNPQILDAVHQDLQKLSQGGRKGRKGDFTSENILRALIVQHLEGLPDRDRSHRGSLPTLGQGPHGAERDALATGWRSADASCPCRLSILVLG